jgi:hypothetical protein
MTMKTLWSKVEPILWFLASYYLFFVVLNVIVYHPKIENLPFWSRIFVLVVIGFWWTGFKTRLAKFLRESLRQMIVAELQESRMAFVTWLREDAPWRGENPFLPPPEEP